jgi:hypothetical protein
MKARHLLLAGGVAVAGWLAIFGNKAPDGDIAEPVVRSQTATAPTEATVSRLASVPASTSAKAVSPTRSSAAAKPASAAEILVLRPREELIGGARTADANALFASQNWAPPPPSLPQQKTEPAPEAVPTAPPLPFTYLGKKSEDGKWEVYLARGDQTYIVREHSVIDPMYRVDSIKPPALSVTYMPLNEIQVLTIGGVE